MVHALCMVERQQGYMLSAWWRDSSGTCSLHGGETAGVHAPCMVEKQQWYMLSAWWRDSSGTCSLHGGETAVVHVLCMVERQQWYILTAWWRHSRGHAHSMVERQHKSMLADIETAFAHANKQIDSSYACLLVKRQQWHGACLMLERLQ